MSNSLTKSVLLSISISISMLTPLAQQAQAAEDPEKVLAKASELLTQGKNKPALDMLKDLVRTNPNNAQVHEKYGKALAFVDTKNNYGSAINEEEIALKLDPKSFGARIVLAQIYANLDKSDESIRLFKEACDIKPTSPGAHRDLGIAYLASQKNELAIAAFKQAIHLKQDMPEVHFKLAVAYLGVGNIDDSIASFKRALELDPKNKDAHIQLAILLNKRGNYRDAMAEAGEAVQLNSGDPNAQLALANIKLESGDEDGSVEPFKNALRCNKQHDPLVEANALSGLGWAVASKGASPPEMDEGTIDQKRAIKIFPEFVPAYVRLAELLSKQEKNKEAEEAYRLGIRTVPNDAALGTAFGKFLERQGRKDDARKAFSRVLEKSPQFKPASDALAALDHGTK